MLHGHGPGHLHGVLVEGHQHALVLAVIAGEGHEHEIAQVVLPHRRRGLDAAGHAGDGLHRQLVLAHDLAGHGVDLEEGGHALVAAVLGEVKGGAHVQVRLGLRDHLQHRGGVGVVLGVGDPLDLHGVEVDALEEAVVGRQVDEPVPDGGAALVTQPLVGGIGLVDLIVGVVAVVPELDDMGGIHRDGAAPGVEDCIELHGVQDPRLRRPDQGVSGFVHQRRAVVSVPVADGEGLLALDAELI